MFTAVPGRVSPEPVNEPESEPERTGAGSFTGIYATEMSGVPRAVGCWRETPGASRRPRTGRGALRAPQGLRQGMRDALGVERERDEACAPGAVLVMRPGADQQRHAPMCGVDEARGRFARVPRQDDVRPHARADAGRPRPPARMMPGPPPAPPPAGHAPTLAWNPEHLRTSAQVKPTHTSSANTSTFAIELSDRWAACPVRDRSFPDV